MSYLETTKLLDDTLLEWSIAVGLGIGTLLVLYLVLRIVRGRIAKIAAKTTMPWDDLVVEILSRTKLVTLVAVGAEVAAIRLALPTAGRHGLHVAVATVLLIQGGLWIGSLIDFLVALQQKRHGADGATVTTINGLAIGARILVWSVVLLLVLDNMGLNVGALVTGLGIGGVAVALAVQNILGDLFASLSIVLDKPFVVGDFIVVGDLSGSVEHVGLKTTRVRSLSGEQLVFSNADLLGSRIRNFGRMFERRVVFSIGVTYDTPRSAIETIPKIIRESVEACDKARFDRSHFKEFGASSLNFESVYYVTVADYTAYMDIQQQINLAIHQRFEAEKIEFAYPTQVVYVKREDQASAES